MLLLLIFSSCETESPDKVRNPENFQVKIKGLTPNGAIDYDLNIVESITELGHETIRLLHRCEDLPADGTCNSVRLELGIPARYTNSDQDAYLVISITNKIDDEDHIWNLKDQNYNATSQFSVANDLRYSLLSVRYDGTTYGSEYLLPSIGFTDVFSDNGRLSGSFSFKVRTNDQIGYALDVSGYFDANIADDIDF